MNEQIDKLSELAEEAGLHREWFIDNPEIERFAELIIEECVDIAAKADIDGCNIGNRAWKKIQEHFGAK